jgi:hypothetical protein
MPLGALPVAAIQTEYSLIERSVSTTECFKRARTLESASFHGDRWDKVSCPGQST